ncbi:Coatomer subunit [Arachis hypogaea]|nr:Coatomer subunit [Arachis hypogaea]
MEQNLSLDFEHEFVQNSERVKSVDLHPTEPCYKFITIHLVFNSCRVLVGLYSGSISIWNYQTKTEEKSFKLSESPVRSAKFIARENWVIAASDDKYIRVCSYETGQKISEFEEHTDYIRSLAVHPFLPYVVSASDDNVLKLWDWKKSWACLKTFQGHSHYVMSVAFNPKDPSTFASASLDGTLKIWSVDSSAPILTLDGHLKGVNCADYFISNDKEYLISGSDDYTAKGHGNNVIAVCSHSELPIIITASEDSTVKIWDNVTNRLQNTLKFDLERIWSIGYKKGSSRVAFGCDKGFVIVKINIEAVKQD